VDTVLKFPEWQDIRLDRLERRIQQLEPAIRVMRRELADVLRRADERQAEPAGTEE
jgi:hypothetical protein